MSDINNRKRRVSDPDPDPPKSTTFGRIQIRIHLEPWSGSRSDPDSYPELDLDPPGTRIRIHYF